MDEKWCYENRKAERKKAAALKKNSPELKKMKMIEYGRRCLLEYLLRGNQ